MDSNKRFIMKRIYSQYLIVDILSYAFYRADISEFLFTGSKLSREFLFKRNGLIKNQTCQPYLLIDEIEFQSIESSCIINHEHLLLYRNFISPFLKVQFSTMDSVRNLIQYAQKIKNIRIYSLHLQKLYNYSVNWFKSQRKVLKKFKVKVLQLEHCNLFVVKDIEGLDELIIRPFSSLQIKSRGTIKNMKKLSLLQIQNLGDLKILNYVKPLESLQITFKIIVDEASIRSQLSQVPNLIISQPQTQDNPLYIDISAYNSHQFLVKNSSITHQNIFKAVDIRKLQQQNSINQCRLQYSDIKTFLSNEATCKKLILKNEPIFFDLQQNLSSDQQLEVKEEQSENATEEITIDYDSNQNVASDYLRIVQLVSQSCQNIRVLTLTLDKNFQSLTSTEDLKFQFNRLQKLKLILDNSFSEEDLFGNIIGNSNLTLESFELVYYKLYLSSCTSKVCQQLKQSLKFLQKLKEFSLSYRFSEDFETFLCESFLPELKQLRQATLLPPFDLKDYPMKIIQNYLIKEEFLDKVQIRCEMEEDDLKLLIISKAKKNYCFINSGLQLPLQKYLQYICEYPRVQIRACAIQKEFVKYFDIIDEAIAKAKKIM